MVFDVIDYLNTGNATPHVLETCGNPESAREYLLSLSGLSFDEASEIAQLLSLDFESSSYFEIMTSLISGNDVAMHRLSMLQIQVEIQGRSFLVTQEEPYSAYPRREVSNIVM